LVSISLTFSYIITIGCAIWQKTKGPGIPTERFSLGRYSITINILGVIFIAPIMVLAAYVSYQTLYNPPY